MTELTSCIQATSLIHVCMYVGNLKLYGDITTMI